MPINPSPQQIQELISQEIARRTYLSRDLLAFTQLFETNYLAGWVHKDICHRLERFSREVIDGRSPRLMLLMPPRHGKSLLASQMLPAWHLGQRPDHEIINVGYNQDLPTKFSRRVREIMQQPEYLTVFPDAQLDTKSQSVEAWMTTSRGGFTAAGRGGGITGKGAHVLIVDDPLKNMEEADNFEIREKLEDWYFSTAYTRLAPGGGVLIIQTMWSDDDLAGRLVRKMEQESGVDCFEVIRYPAISTEYEYRDKNTYEMVHSDIPLTTLTGSGSHELLRAPGEPLHADRYDLKYLLQIKANMAPRIWSALFQQNPVPEEGLFFRQDMMHVSPARPSYVNRRFFMAWDFAISEKQRADFTVGVCLMQDENDNLYLVDVVRFKGDMQRIAAEFVGMIQRWSQYEGSSLQLGVEDGQIWKSLKDVLRTQMREDRAYVSIEVMQALTDKESRAKALQGRMELQRFWFLEGSPWINEVQMEMLRFPAGRHDDIVDALSWAVRLSTGKQPKRPPKKKALPSWKDNLRQFMGNSMGKSHLSA